jgi:hypothetical protein
MSRIDPKLFISLSFGFIAAVVIGTLSHEYGHLCIAQYLGYSGHIHFASFSLEPKCFSGSIPDADYILISLGGPLQTMLTGTLALLTLYISQKKTKEVKQLSVSRWILVFLALFWLRPLVNLIVWVSSYFINGTFSEQGDELHLALYLDLLHWSLLTLCAAMGTFVLTLILVNFIPERQRITFMLSAVVGGISGYIIWLLVLGKYILP